MATKKIDKDAYDADSIVQLPFPLNVRTRPQVYLGNLDEYGSLTCLREIVNNSVDEHLRGFCNKIAVERLSENSFSVSDNGRGVPFDKHESGKNSLEVIFGELHSGRNFDSTKKEYTTGINGVGSSATCAVSESFKATAWRKKEQGCIVFKQGEKKSLKLTPNVDHKSSSGTLVEFTLDPVLFLEGYVSEEDLVNFLRETAYLNNNLEISYKAIGKKTVTFLYTNGTEEFLKEFYKEANAVCNTISVSGIDKGNKIEASFVWTKDFKPEEIHSFCNTIRTAEHGQHVTGLKRSISQYMVEYVKKNKLIKEPIENEDVFNGLVVVCSAFVFNPKYSTQTKSKLMNSEVGGSSFSVVSTGLKDWLDRNPKALKILAERFALTCKARLASKRAVELVKKESSSFLSSLNSISKFSDCMNGKGDDAELIVVEGASAAGTVCDGRDKQTQAVYELKGKPLNAINTDTEKVAKNKEISDLITVLKCGTLSNCDPSKTKFSRIIILADADDDGKAIIS